MYKKMYLLAFDAVNRGQKSLLLKLSVLIVLLSTMQAAAYTFMQNVTMNVKNVRLTTVLRDLQKQSGYRLLYDNSIVSPDLMVTLHVNNGSVEKVLNEILPPHQLEYKIHEKNIVLNRKLNAAVSQISKASSVVQKTVTGRVTSKESLPLEGVSVVEKGTSNTVVTNENGQYTIRIGGSQASLYFSIVGYERQELSVGQNTNIDVVLVPQINQMEEVVVTGYSSQRKKDITGSVVVVKMDQLKSLPATSADQALQGLASGVNVITSGAPGGEPNIRVRGVTSFGNNSPLVIVDGVQQSLQNINMNDIESMQVLKDAGAAAIYGVRGSNGVILVTTKQGKTGAPTISYDGFYDIKSPIPGNPFDLMNSMDYMNIYNLALPGNALFSKGMPDYMYKGPGISGVAMEGDPAVNPNLYFYEKQNTGRNYIIQKVNKDRQDWFHDLFKTAATQNHSVNASGGTDKAKYLFGLGLADQKGTMVETFMKRYTARVNTSFNIGKNIRVGENLNFYHRDQQLSTAGVGNTFQMQPMIPLKDIAGNWGGTFGGPNLSTFVNPVAIQARNKDKDKNYDWGIVGNAYGELDFLKRFTLRSSIGYNIVNAYEQDYAATQTENTQASTGNNSLSITSGFVSTMTLTNTLKYEHTFNKHSVTVLAGSEYIRQRERFVNGSSQQFFSDDINFLVLNNGTSSITNTSRIAANALYSLFSRADYNYDNRYLLGATVRRDGSSVFGPESRYGVFPSFSLGWRLSQEKFMKEISWVSDLKLKGSWGILGSQNNVTSTNAYSLYEAGMGTTYYDIRGTSNSIVQGFAQSRIGNPATGWEENVVTNVGFETTLFNNTLEINAEYYKKSINGLLFVEQPPAAILGGATAPTINVGDIQNSGLDASINYRGKIKSDFNYNVGVNFTSYKNTVVDIPAPGYFYGTSLETVGIAVINREGDPVSSYYGYKIIGLFNSAAEVAAAPVQTGAEAGRFRYQDVNNDGKITPDDRTILGDPNPDFTYGVNLGLNYKNVDFSAFFYGSQGNDLFNYTRNTLDFFQYYYNAKSNRLLDAWTPTNTDTKVPKLEAISTLSTNGTANSYFVEDGSYLRLKSIVLGYTLSPSVSKKIGLNRLRIYAQSANLFTITNYSGLDPEIGGGTSNFGVDGGDYPNNEMSIVFGLNIGL